MFLKHPLSLQPLNGGDGVGARVRMGVQKKLNLGDVPKGRTRANASHAITGRNTESLSLTRHPVQLVNGGWCESRGLASQRSTSTFNRGCTGDMAMASRKAESEVEIAFAFALGIEALRP